MDYTKLSKAQLDSLYNVISSALKCESQFSDLSNYELYHSKLEESYKNYESNFGDVPRLNNKEILNFIKFYKNT